MEKIKRKNWSKHVAKHMKIHDQIKKDIDEGKLESEAPSDDLAERFAVSRADPASSNLF